MLVDLHVHTHYSDGRLSPRQVVEAAAERGLRAVAITDHDVVDGVGEAVAAGEELGVEVVAGVELTADWDGQTVHILGLFIDPGAAPLRAALDRAATVMRRYVEEALAEIASMGLELRREELLQYRGRYPSGAAILLKAVEKGFLRHPSKGRALLRLARREPRALSYDDAIDVIHRAGGIASLAHPVRLCRGDELHTAEQLRPLVVAGLDAIEAWHVIHDGQVRAHYQQLARQLDLLVTGGSDCHGPRRSSGLRLGSQKVPLEVLDHLRAAVARKSVR